jgi:osmoprotectant transport system permease protein
VDEGGGHVSLSAIWGWFSDPANWQGTDGVPSRVLEHLLYTALTLLIALVVAVPLGAWVGHSGRLRWLVTGANAARAVPTLGLLFAVSMFVGPLIQSDLAFVIPSIAVLVLLAIPPLLSGTYAGIDSVEPAARDAARGMGMTGWQVLTKVEAPCALPLFLSGLRSATLQVIATATIAASVSLGGLGRYLIDGLASRDYVQMVCGSILVAVLALVADGLLALLEKRAVSPGISGRATRVARSRARNSDPHSEPDPDGADGTDPDPRQAALVGSGSTGPVQATATTGTPSERDRT